MATSTSCPICRRRKNGSAKPQRINRSPAPSRPLAPSATLTAPPNQPASLADAAAQLAPADHRHKDAAENVKRPELWCEDTAYHAVRPALGEARPRPAQ